MQIKMFCKCKIYAAEVTKALQQMRNKYYQNAT